MFEQVDSDVFFDTADILLSFNPEEITNMIHNQLYPINVNFGDLNSSYINYLEPLYDNFKKIQETEYIDDNTLIEARDKFSIVCYIIMNQILEKFNITIDSEFYSDNYAKMYNIASALYSFFVLNFSSNCGYKPTLNSFVSGTENS